MTTRASSAPLERHTKLLVAGSTAGVAAILGALSIHFLFFLTDVIGLTGAAAATIMLVGRSFETLVNPIIGVLSDRARSRWGRRRVFVLAGSVPIALATVFVWNAPNTDALGAGAAFWWMLGALLLFFACQSFLYLPLSCWVVEMTFDYQERTTLSAYSGIGGVFGYLAGAAGFPWIAGQLQPPEMGYRVAALVIGAIALCTSLAVGVFLRERGKAAKRAPTNRPSFREFASTVKNGAFYRLQGSFLVSRIAFALMASSLPYFCTHWLRTPALLPKVMTALIVMVAVCLPLWRRAARNIEKAKAYALGVLVSAAGASGMLLVGRDSSGAAVLFAGLVGAGVSVHWILPASLVADAIDVDEQRTHQRREGLYLAIGATMDRVGHMIATAVLGLGLSYFGYHGGEEAVPSEDVLFGIRMLLGPLPASLMIASAMLLWKHPINEATHRAIREEIDARRSVDMTPHNEAQP